MKFMVTGAHAKTGEEVRLRVEAASAAAAEAEARSAGFFVSDVSPVVKTPTVARQMKDTAPPSRCVAQAIAPRDASGDQAWGLFTRRQRMGVIAAVSALVLLVPLLIWWVQVKDTWVDAGPSQREQPVAELGGDAAKVAPYASKPTASAAPAPRSGKDLQALLVGTYDTSANAESQLSITFNYPRYVLNPSRSFAWTKGNTGTWGIADHPGPTAAQRADGWWVLTMAPPDDANLPMPARVKFRFDEHGQVSAVTFASFLGIEFNAGRHMTLYRKDSSPDAPAVIGSPRPPESTEAKASEKAGATLPTATDAKSPPDPIAAYAVCRSLDNDDKALPKVHNCFIVAKLDDHLYEVAPFDGARGLGPHYLLQTVYTEFTTNACRRDRASAARGVEDHDLAETPLTSNPALGPSGAPARTSCPPRVRR